MMTATKARALTVKRFTNCTNRFELRLVLKAIKHAAKQGKLSLMYPYTITVDTIYALNSLGYKVDYMQEDTIIESALCILSW